MWASRYRKHFNDGYFDSEVTALVYSDCYEDEHLLTPRLVLEPLTEVYTS